MQRARPPQLVAVAHPERGAVDVEGYRVGGVRLDLHGVRAGLGNGAHDLERALEGAVVVAGDLGDDHGALAGCCGHGVSRRSGEGGAEHVDHS